MTTVGDRDVDVATNPLARNASASSRHPGSAGIPVRGLHDLDRFLHAAEGRATSGLSPVSQFMAMLDWGMHLANSPFRQFELAQLACQQTAQLVAAAVAGREPLSPDSHDHRFSARAWQQPPFNLLRQGFLTIEKWWDEATSGPEGVGRLNGRIVSFAARQLLDACSPSNVPWLNPEVVNESLCSGGQNFFKGYQNWLADLKEATSGRPVSEERLKVGRDLVVTPGKVVLRNSLMELIQYSPTTDIVRPEPVLIVPAWIMKYYILDLSPQNSLIKYLIDRGHTVFCISWRNPGVELRDKSLEDYRREGPVAALDAIAAICGADRKVHACGYCLGGTLLAVTASALGRDGKEPLASVTLFAAQTDFTESGELQLFINEDQLAFLEDVMSVQGYLDSRQMAGAFQLLHSNYLIWSRLVKSYMLGEREFPNDLMTWNADGTRMPARMHGEYLRRFFLNNDLAGGRLIIDGKPVAVADIRVPIFVVGTETDHIAPWRSVQKIQLLRNGEVTFVLTSGGHNAGIVSEPGHPHRSYRVHQHVAGGRYLGPDEWLAVAEKREGSWWPEWAGWLDQHSGEPVSPPPIGADGQGYPPLADAPGLYVFER